MWSRLRQWVQFFPIWVALFHLHLYEWQCILLSGSILILLVVYILNIGKSGFGRKLLIQSRLWHCSPGPLLFLSSPCAARLKSENHISQNSADRRVPVLVFINQRHMHTAWKARGKVYVITTLLLCDCVSRQGRESPEKESRHDFWHKRSIFVLTYFVI